MKRLLVVLLLGTILQSTKGLSTEAVKAIIAEDQEMCLKAAPVPQDVRKKVAQKELVHDDTLKKYAQCMGIILGFMNEDGSFNVEGMKHTTAELMGSNQFDSLLVFCSQNPTDDPLTNIWNLAKCLNKNVHDEVFLNFTNTFWAFP